MRFDLNDYSIPHTHVNRTLTLLASLDTVRIVDGQDVIATHPRSFDRGAQVEDPAHVAALVADKRAARAHRAQDRLQHAAPSTKALFLRAAARGAHLGVLTRGLLQLLASHGAAALEAAIAAALGRRYRAPGRRASLHRSARPRPRSTPAHRGGAARGPAAAAHRAAAAVERLPPTRHHRDRR